MLEPALLIIGVLDILAAFLGEFDGLSWLCLGTGLVAVVIGIAVMVED